MINDCHLIKIPFSTKGKLKNKPNSLKIVGFANYVFDKKTEQIIHEYLELIESNYRMTDNNLITTSHYKSKNVTKFRDNFLDKITNHKVEEISTSTFNNLNEYQLKEINEYFKSIITTVKNQFSYLNGSNITGAKKNSKASPLVCTVQKYFQCNFSNPIASYIKDKNEKCKVKNNNYKIAKTITLDEFIDSNKTFEKIFRDVNEWYFINDKLTDINQHNEYMIDENIDSNFINDDKFPCKKDLDDVINNYLQVYFDGTWSNTDKNTDKNHKEMLRRFYTSSIQNKLNNKEIPHFASKIRFHSAVIENAHIISFSSLVNENTLISIKKAINPFNVLRIDSNTHKLFDKNVITFDLDGFIINDKGREGPFLDIENIPKKTIEFLKENYKHWKQYNCNK